MPRMVQLAKLDGFGNVQRVEVERPEPGPEQMLVEVKRRGRWAADSSVRRYEKHARVLRELERLPADVIAYAKVVERRLVPILAEEERAPPPPRPPCRRL